MFVVFIVIFKRIWWFFNIANGQSRPY